jgi:hypothetical protein
MNEDGHVSISRRGLVAAGIAAAVVGSIGAVSIINANADQVTTPPAAAPPAPPADGLGDPTVADKPPAVLPWGSRPVKLTRARIGADSEQVAAAGADVAPKDADSVAVPEAEWAPKGRSLRNGGVKTGTTDVEPPRPPVTGKLDDDNPVNFFYGVGTQVAQSDGAYANLVIGKPRLSRDDYHTLAEIAVQSADSRQIVEVGWNVDRTVNGDANTHLFVYHWVDKVESCYNGCGWVQYSKTSTPGDTLPAGASVRFGIQHANGGWWVAYGTEWIGYFPDELWDGKYTRSGLQQFFGEVAASSATPVCTQMGNGIGANKDTAARVGSINQLNGPDPKVTVKATSDLYPVAQLSDRTFRYGGPGLGGCPPDED